MDIKTPTSEDLKTNYCFALGTLGKAIKFATYTASWCAFELAHNKVADYITPKTIAVSINSNLPVAFISKAFADPIGRVNMNLAPYLDKSLLFKNTVPGLFGLACAAHYLTSGQWIKVHENFNKIASAAESLFEDYFSFGICHDPMGALDHIFA